MEYNLDEYIYSLLLVIIPILVIISIHLIRWREKKQEIFASQRFRDTIFGNSKKRKAYLWILPLFFLGLFSLIVAIVNIIGDTKTIYTKQNTGNIIFAIDVSNSMNAEDIEHSRLNQAKNIIINSIPNFSSNRIGIIVFAGNAKSIMPLTTDYLGAESYIEAIETSVIKIQGTDFLNAISVAVEKFLPVEKHSRKLILISDGEDNEENLDKTIQLANKEDINITTIGIGTEEGAPIPEYYLGQLMGYKIDNVGEIVLSKRQSNALKELASETGGIYIDGNEMETAITQLSKYITQDNKKGSSVRIKSENTEYYYQYPLAISFICFTIILLFNPKKDFNI